MKDGWLACDNEAPTDATSDTLDCLHITSKLRFKNVLNPALEACQQMRQTTVFTLFQIVLFCLKWVGSFFFPKQTKSVSSQGNYKGIHMGAAEKTQLLDRARKATSLCFFN